MFDAPPGSSVQNSPDLQRIKNLPRRVYETHTVEELQRTLTDALKTPYGQWSLYPVQALALIEIARHHGLLGPIRVGGGKTLISLLAPRMIPGIIRPLILLPAHLIKKTETETQELRSHWVLPPFYRLMSYQALGRESGEAFLNQYKPDMVIADEVHYLKNRGASCTKKFTRYLKKRHTEGQTVAFVGISGTITKRSIKDFAHLAGWALREGSPVPVDPRAIEEWARALDVNVAPHRRMLPGKLTQLRKNPLEDIRETFRKRFVETPGVVATQEGPLPISLEITGHMLDAPDTMIPDWSRLRSEWETPDGRECMDAMEVWRHAKELAVGCFYRWNPLPHKEWALARKGWGQEARHLVSANRSGYDTEMQVRNAVLEGWQPKARPALDAWLAAQEKHPYDPSKHTEVVWQSDHACRWILEWAKKNTGIIWVHHRGLGQRLAQLGLPYYANGGKEITTGVAIEKALLRDGPIVASISSNGTGRNLQRWHRNLVVGVPSNGSQWEQLLGRTHRNKQKADTVYFDILFGCHEDVAGFHKAVDDARYAEDMTGQAQKLTHAAMTNIPDVRDLPHTTQWQKT